MKQYTKILEAIKQTLLSLDDSEKEKCIASILVYGVPGIGKTFKVEKAIEESAPEGHRYVRVTAIDFHQKWQPLPNKPFREIISARCDPNHLLVMFVDDLEFISNGQSSRCKELEADFMSLFQGDHKSCKVLLIGASQKPWHLSESIIERFNCKIYVGMPDFDERTSMIQEMASSDPVFDVPPEKVEEIADKLEGYTPADITVLFRDDAMEPLRKLMHRDENINRPSLDLNDSELEAKIPPPSIDDIFMAMKKNKPTISKCELANFEEQCRNKNLLT